MGAGCAARSRAPGSLFVRARQDRPHERLRADAIEDLRASAPVETGRLGHHTVLETADARVIVLAFEGGHHMKEHRAPRPLPLQAVDGHLRITAAERTADLRPGGLKYLPAVMPHAVEAVEASRLSLILLGS